MKLCHKCGIEKPLTEFYRHKGHADGHCSQCKPCVLAAVNAYKAANPEKVLIGHRIASTKYLEANRDKERARTLAAYYADLDVERARRAGWRKANPHKLCAKQNRRRARKLSATPSWANQKYIDIFYRMATEESERIGEEVHVDHIVPLVHPRVCGLHCEFNLQLLTGKENLSKGNRHWPGM